MLSCCEVNWARNHLSGFFLHEYFLKMHWWQAMHANNSWQRIVDIDSVICNSALWGGLLAIEEDIKCTTAIQPCHAFAYPPHCCVPENCMGLGQIVQGFLQILLSSKTNEDNKDKWFHLTHWQPHLCACVIFCFFWDFEPRKVFTLLPPLGGTLLWKDVLV